MELKKKKSISMQNKGVKLTLGSSLSLRKVLKHLITLSYLVVIIILVVRISIDVTNFDLAYWAKKGKSIAWLLLLSIMLVISMSVSLKMLNKSFKSFIVNSVFIAALFVTVAYVAIWQSTIEIKEWSDLLKILVIFIWIPLYVFVWEFAVSYFEKNTSPLLSKMVFFKAVAHMLFFAFIFMVFVLLAQTFRPSVTYGIVNLTKQKFDFWDPFQQTLVFLIIFTFIGYVFFAIYAFAKYRKAVKNDWNSKFNSLSLSVVIVIPLTVWLTINAWFFIPKLDYILFILGNVIAVLFVISFVFLKKTELASQKVFSVIIASALTFIWGMKLYFYNQHPQMSGGFTIIFSLMSTSSIIMLLYYKNDKISKSTSLTITLFVFLVFIASLIIWGKIYIDRIFPSLFDIAKSFGLDPIEIFHSLLFSTIMSLLFASIVSWTLTNTKLKRLAKQKEYKENKKLEEQYNKKIKNTKEATHA